MSLKMRHIHSGDQDLDDDGFEQKGWMLTGAAALDLTKCNERHGVLTPINRERMRHPDGDNSSGNGGISCNQSGGKHTC